MNLLIVHPNDFISENMVSISGPRLHHIRNILKTDIDQSLAMGILNGSIGTGILASRNESRDLFQVQFSSPPPPALNVTLILALPRPKVFRRILQSITSLGVKHIILLHAFRVEKSYWQSPFLSDTSIFTQCIKGLEQAKDTMVPFIQMEKKFKPFVEDQLPLLLKDKKGYIAHPYCESSFGNPEPPAVVAIGPEGGFIPYEVQLLEKAGMQSFSMGARILTTETAASVLLSRFLPF
ncbi:16S rRNA (uracil(1498)-N(3))-methyltransferase [Desulfobotulus sp. H1]|uniref:Ribosomal RNA small subunit methyltransferase E n=1 Tax=Desulfobotulus pelophilus TaxID=2823377 RepID=A0ABT3NBW9_9BACT|nr:16S rRNA (uracil(1498)-N(3))-methyltransferase [Desulfobotulus pelophilus]MCW7754963.1 16S rRNA (uracil(1498)-N(3))-methyltransferase [Desulfobotulus pelophilus]